MTRKQPISTPEPWVDANSDAPDAHLGALFRAVAEPEALSAASLARVHDRLLRASSRTPAQRRWREVVMATAMLLAGSSIALAGWGASEWWRARSEPSAPATQPAPPPTIPEPKPRVVPAVRPVPTVAEQPVAPEPAAAPTSAAIERVARPAASADSSAIAAEAQVLERVLVKLRREHDAQGALGLLDESQALFARGSLALEAQVARIDALLALGRKAEALAQLERLPFAQVGRGGELRLMRAELRAESDCGLALSDFDVLVSQALASSLAERALYGRAACELQVGDREHAEQDFQQYLSRFPAGRFAPRVQARLSTLKAP